MNERLRILEDLEEKAKEIVPKDWYFIATRTNTPPLPVWLKFPFNEAISRKLYGVKLEWVAFWHEPYGEFYLKSKEFRKTIEATTKLLLSDKAKTHLNNVMVLSEKAKEKASFFLNNDLTKLSNEELQEKYDEVIKVYSFSFIHGFVTWCSKIFQGYVISILKKHLKELKKLDLDEKNAFAIMAISDKLTDYIKKEQALDELAKKPVNKKDVEKFLEDYNWVGYDYGGPAMTYEEVVEILEEREERPKPSVTKKDILDACSFTDSEKEVFEIISGLMFIKDARNNCDDFVHYSLDFFYTEVGKRFNLTRKEARFLWPKELKEMLQGKETYDKEYLQKKMEFSAAETTPKKSECNYYVGDEARKFIKKTIQIKEESSDVDELKGSTASPGKASGKVKIIRVLDDMKKFQKGDVLVTHMTSPRFMAAISKSSAIITDEGGITSHAAIVSRELGIPCIVGTKIATKVFKDGDLVEVDADKGMVRKIK